MRFLVYTRSQNHDGAERSSAQPEAPAIGCGTRWALIAKILGRAKRQSRSNNQRAYLYRKVQ